MVIQSNRNRCYLMSRVGQNPLKWIGINKKPEKITIVTIVYIPDLSGFLKIV